LKVVEKIEIFFYFDDLCSPSVEIETSATLVAAGPCDHIVETKSK
jgi:hypothetical protein